MTTNPTIGKPLALFLIALAASAKKMFDQHGDFRPILALQRDEAEPVFVPLGKAFDSEKGRGEAIYAMRALAAIHHATRCAFVSEGRYLGRRSDVVLLSLEDLDDGQVHGSMKIVRRLLRKPYLDELIIDERIEMPIGFNILGRQA
jgi:hypothetical protein